MLNKYEEIFNEKLGDLIKDVPYPFAHSHRFLMERAGIAMQFHTCESLEISIDEYEIVANRVTDPLFNLPDNQMAFVHTALLAVKLITPAQFGISLWQYAEHKRVFNDMQRIWDETAAPYIKQSTEYAQSIAKRDERELSAKSKLKGLNGKSLAFPSR